MKKIPILVTLFLGVITILPAQEIKEEKFELYNPKAVVEDDLAKAMQQALTQNKNIMVQIGGNWCKWCKYFYNFTKFNHDIDSVMNANYVVMHVNYSKENKNLSFLEKMEYPQRFGYPVFVILNANGRRIHTQSSWYLEDGKTSYDKEKVLAFLNNWSPAAMDPKSYVEKK